MSTTLSLRDTFAAHAAQGLLASDANGVLSSSKIAETAYSLADNMMIQRQKNRVPFFSVRHVEFLEPIVQSAQAAGIGLFDVAQALQAVALDPSALSGYSRQSNQSPDSAEF